MEWYWWLITIAATSVGSAAVAFFAFYLGVRRTWDKAVPMLTWWNQEAIRLQGKLDLYDAAMVREQTQAYIAKQSLLKEAEARNIAETNLKNCQQENARLRGQLERIVEGDRVHEAMEV